MTPTTEHQWHEEYDTLAAERFKLGAELNRPNHFKTPEARTEAARRFKELTGLLNSKYLEKNGLR